MSDYEPKGVSESLSDDEILGNTAYLSPVEKEVQGKNRGRRAGVITTLVSILGFPIIGPASIGLGAALGTMYYGSSVVDEEEEQRLKQGELPLTVFDDCF